MPVKVTLALAGLPLPAVHPASGPDILAPGRGNLHIGLDLMVEAQIIVNIVGSGLTGRNGPALPWRGR